MTCFHRPYSLHLLNLAVNGHTHIWHSQTPHWFFQGNGRPAGRELLLTRMRAHIPAVAGRFGDMSQSWIVVNGAINDGGGHLRPSPRLALTLKHRDKVKRVAFRGIHDGSSWPIHFPSARTNHPLLWNRNLQPKPAFFAESECALNTSSPAPNR